jgi:glycosyltransferase involved in cell wall biosynthesis
VHAHFGVEGAVAQRPAKDVNMPLVTTLHGYDVTLSNSALLRSGSANWVRYAVARRRFLESAETLISVSRHIADRAIALGARDSALTILHTGVDLAPFTPVARPEEPSILHVGRLVEKKGATYLLAAFARVLRSVPEARLRIIGDGPLRARLEDQALGLGIRHAVAFEGTVSHETVIQAIRDSSVLCLPSVTATSGDQEGLGQVLLEASASARPVVATKHGGIVDAVVDGTTGYLVAERDPNALAEALVAILDSGHLAERLGAQGRAFVEQHFDANVQARKLAQIYQRALHL